MKTLIALLIVMSFGTAAYSQVVGKLVSADGTAVDFATVSVLRSPDSAAVRSALSDGNGAFSFTGISNGSYILKVTSLVHITWSSKPFVITPAQPGYDVGTVVLAAASKQLGEVIIRSNKPLVQQQPGGLVVNVQNSLMAKGSTVLQVLQRSPGVVLDPQHSGISLNGKSGVMVMLDGKLLRLTTEQVTALLNGMTADDLDKIELLSTPPARYDADGNAGLINIVTKKNKKQGTSGSVTASAGYGKGEKGSAGLNLNHNSGKLSLRGSYDYAHDRSYSLLLAEGSEVVGILGGQSAFQYNGESKPFTTYNGMGAGLDYRVSPTLTVGGALNYAISTNDNNNHNFGSYLLPDTTLAFDSQLVGNSRTHYLHPSLYLEQTIGKDQKLNIDLDYFGHYNRGLTQVQSDFSNSVFGQRQRNFANADINVGVAKIDYTNPFSKVLRLESGLKSTYTRSQSTAGIEKLVDGNWVNIGAGTSNDLATKEFIGGAYAILNWQADSLTNISAGARYEYSRNSTNHSLDAAYLIDRKLGKLFPSIFLTRKLNATDELQLSYTERVTRPTFADLASYVSYNDPVSVFTGNPALKPTITHNLKLAYNRQDYLFSVLYSRDINPIQGVQIMTGPTPGLVYLMPENGDWQNNFLFQATIPIKPAAWWEMSYGFVGGLHQYKVSYFPQPLQKTYFSYNINFSESFKLPLQYAIELSGYYNSSAYDSNSGSSPNAAINLGFKKELPNQKGSFQLSVSDLFSSVIYRAKIGQLTTDAFNTDVRVSYQPESRFFPIIKLSYSRALGTNSKASRKNKGTDDEQKRL
ncbi:TonB-dependent receptor domain-containing protein [Mucilaginibacter psychrotolerans]|nr:TonB-dependent receptor [Mucilaginibacter psychrotolerans]